MVKATLFLKAWSAPKGTKREEKRVEIFAPSESAYKAALKALKKDYYVGQIEKEVIS